MVYVSSNSQLGTSKVERFYRFFWASSCWYFWGYVLYVAIIQYVFLEFFFISVNPSLWSHKLRYIPISKRIGIWFFQYWLKDIILYFYNSTIQLSSRISQFILSRIKSEETNKIQYIKSTKTMYFFQTSLNLSSE